MWKNARWQQDENIWSVGRVVLAYTEMQRSDSILDECDQENNNFDKSSKRADRLSVCKWGFCQNKTSKNGPGSLPSEIMALVQSLIASLRDRRLRPLRRSGLPPSNFIAIAMTIDQPTQASLTLSYQALAVVSTHPQVVRSSSKVQDSSIHLIIRCPCSCKGLANGTYKFV